MLGESVVHGRARVEGAVVDGATVRGRVSRLAFRADAGGDPRLLAALGALGWAPAKTTASPLSPRGSSRSFTRIECASGSAMAISYELDRRENGLYVQNGGFLADLGVPVPRVLADLPHLRVSVLQDCGSSHLQEAVGSRSLKTVTKLYERVLSAILILHKRGAAAAQRQGLALCPPFSPRLYRWEHDLFISHFLCGRLGLREAGLAALRRELGRISRALGKEPQVMIHRDLQSSNVLLSRGRPIFIDFQGMRLGPAAYDVASLLFDPYVSLPSDLQERLAGVYAARAGIDSGDFHASLQWAAAQRLIQAIGAYARLGASPSTRQFAQHIGPGLRLLRRALDGLPDLTHLRGIVGDALGS